ncbi:hypothetical protein Hanom_Chr15g01410291 [Helianthus anomalus]
MYRNCVTDEPQLHHQMICCRGSYLVTQLLFASLQPWKVYLFLFDQFCFNHN